MSKETGGSAFPSPGVIMDNGRGEQYQQGAYEGMSLRDYFAAKALQGFCANPAVFAANGMSGWSLVNCTEQQLLDYCGHLADVMLVERAK